MDDFTLSNLHESRNEWSARLITILTPLRSVFNIILLTIVGQLWKNMSNKCQGPKQTYFV